MADDSVDTDPMRAFVAFVMDCNSAAWDCGACNSNAGFCLNVSTICDSVDAVDISFVLSSVWICD